MSHGSSAALDESPENRVAHRQRGGFSCQFERSSSPSFPRKRESIRFTGLRFLMDPRLRGDDGIAELVAKPIPALRGDDGIGLTPRTLEP